MIDRQTLLTTPNGRLGRQSYWTLLVVMVAAGFVLSLVPFFGQLLSLALLWPFGCVVAKRLHDTGRRAWMVPVAAALNVAAVALSFTAAVMATDPGHVVAAFGLAVPALMLGGLSMVVTLSLVIFAGAAVPSAGNNRFGPPEKVPVTIATLLPLDRA
jgi:uncharacterized membrane protein YhaH (DUF805 family)